MKTILTILVAIGMLATLGTLFAGMLGLAKGDGTGERSNLLMRWRVVLQGITLLLFALLLAISRG
ncbi:twin transmembrane helix small protein [Belnapia rosea]|uniref:Hypoxia induced protein conserved region n=1 Tax=Belnapia rosea TaxID=938405 RepID=A0A1G7B3Y8_9PROT|nr:twin transmembrane helix small protein [Belnapia rosea]SDB33227.1 Hypoxia induced protein conserved region [Belnapia rosea]SDE21818.1 Hypoxia induced protein conserved region [Belnapia rosea]